MIIDQQQSCAASSGFLGSFSGSLSESKMSDLDELNRTLYDIGAQDLLDVWENMETEDASSTTSSTWSASSTSALPSSSSEAANNLGVNSNNNNNSNGNSNNARNCINESFVLKDRLLTDSLLLEEFPVAVKQEHSYSLGAAGSDGDSLPASPISLHDDMETECYPCIPMHSASNQSKSGLKNGQKFPVGASEVITIKQEPRNLDVNVIDDTCNVKFVKNFPSNNQQGSLLAKHHPHTTVHFARPKHPKSLLKQKPVTHTILVTTTSPNNVTPSNNNNNNNCNSSSKLIFTKLSSTSTTSVSCSSPLLSSKPSLLLDKEGIKPSPIFHSQELQNQQNIASLTNSLISNQQADSTGVLILTEEEKKTLIAEGYPIPTRLPLSKSEEKSLKKIRRKIKNKISAQESRRKKKEFVDTLERQVEETAQELGAYKRKCQTLEKENATLLAQLKSLRAMVVSASSQEQELKIKTEIIEHEGPVCDGIGLD